MSPATKLLAGVELGGTKCVCILGTGPDDVRAVERLPTGEREETLRQIEAVLDRWRAQHGAPRALGLASFGPIDLRAGSPTYGFITSTPKAGWRNTEVAQRLARRSGAPLGFDTDVNGAALAEGRWGAARGLEDFAYVTVGTGIGVGTIVRGRSVFGMNHTELGHIRVARKAGDKFAGTCSFHGDCIEGLASGPAIEARAGLPASQLPPDHPAWDYVAHALAQLMHVMVLSTAPVRIFLGGGVMAAQNHL
ncbi:MAG: ROK family protein, partial [Pseudomonadota bacterium]